MLASSVTGDATDRSIMVNDEQILRRPIGWWLKEADSRLDAAFDSALSTHGVDRRAWQVLATLSRSATARTAVIAAFDEPAVVEAVIDDLHRRGWVEDSDGLLTLTSEGTREHGVLAPLVDDVRRQVVAALPENEYITLVRLLARLVAAFPEPSA